ncbi:hypothetical protein D5S17_34880 [Pseudonocardiaceae bacterium YIM PH 21723]|nr:hypothetical protein D5S17_34880 [Pseudonocardiaceae bacterium YIM PH 21723]
MTAQGTSIAVAVGIVVAFGFDRLVQRVAPRHATRLDALALVVAAAIYPALRSGEFREAGGLREFAGLGAYGALGLVTACKPTRPLSELVAAAWASHALFDLLHDKGHQSRLPAWYPAFCAGFDIALAALMRRDRCR